MQKFLATLVLILALPLSPLTHAKQEDVPLDDLRRFTNVINHVRQYYVEETNDTELFEDAIRGMLSGLDPHSLFLSPEEFTELKESTSGKFGGLGIEVTLSDGVIQVISPIDNTPAAKAGIQPGDKIVRLNETPVKGLGLKKAIDIMRGEPGEPIELLIIREGATEPISLTVVRDIIHAQSVKSKMLEDDFGYIRISQFQSKTGKEVKDALHDLVSTNKAPLKGLILDLRNNPGGVFEAAVEVSDTFIDAATYTQHQKMLVYTEGRLSGSQIKEFAHRGDKLNGAPVIVLINGGSASASEIVSGALQDHKRALILGTRSFGKGSVQTILPLDQDYGLKITTARYYTPAGRSIQALGIEPDIIVHPGEVPESKEPTWSPIRERDLDGHLTQQKQPDSDVEEENFEAITDFQLLQGLNLLKGLAAFQKS